jgi:glycosyltransferase involved in cell wall biosynthesis
MRILMLSKACLVGTYQRKLEELARLPDVDLTVVVPPSWRDERGVQTLERAHTQGYNLFVEPIALNGQFHLHFYPGLGRRMRQVQPDLVHVDEEPYNLATVQAMWLARRAGARTLFFSWQNLKRRYPLPFRWFERATLRWAEYAIAGNCDAMDVWRSKGYTGPMRVIPQFGVDPETFRPSPDGRAPGRGFIAGYVGRLVEEKGVDVLLRAAAALPGAWRLYIVGEGPARAGLIALARELNIAERVIFDPWIPSTRVPAYYGQLDVLVLPSRTRPNWKEQFGRVLVEAMACGVPVIGSTCGEIPNVIGDAGLIFPEEDVAALRGALERLMRDDALRAVLAARGRARVLARYTQAQVARETWEVYRELIGLPQAARSSGSTERSPARPPAFGR